MRPSALRRDKGLRLRRGCARLIALLAALAALAGCAAPPAAVLPTPPAEPTPTPVREAEGLPFVLPCYPSAGFHPITGGSRTNRALAGLMYEGLFAVNESFEAVPVLCTGWTVSFPSFLRMMMDLSFDRPSRPD